LKNYLFGEWRSIFDLLSLLTSVVMMAYLIR
jgi:hypothetical protein